MASKQTPIREGKETYPNKEAMKRHEAKEPPKVERKEERAMPGKKK